MLSPLGKRFQPNSRTGLPPTSILTLSVGLRFDIWRVRSAPAVDERDRGVTETGVRSPNPSRGACPARSRGTSLPGTASESQTITEDLPSCGSFVRVRRDSTFVAVPRSRRPVAGYGRRQPMACLNRHIRLRSEPRSELVLLD